MNEPHAESRPMGRRIAALVVDLGAAAVALLLGLALAEMLATVIYGAALESPQDGTEAWHHGLWLLLPALLPVAIVAYYNHVRPLRRWGRSIGMLLVGV